jgi:hypothetical protein
MGIIITAGCGSAAFPLDEPVAVKGKLSSKGSAVGDILLTFQPLGNGHLTPVEVGSDGLFECQLIPGEYAYFVGKSAKSAGSEKSLSRVDPKYREPALDRKVAVPADQDLAISFD